jgi:glycosyltransferase involved in cell wall biosynthesis
MIIVIKALEMAGTSFRVIHCGPSPLAINTERSGVFEGIPFEYTATVKRPSNTVARLLVYVWAVSGLTIRLCQLRAIRRNTAVWLYIQDGPISFYVGSLCRLLGIPVVQELCEWWPGWPNCSAFTKWLYRKQIFKNATGALVISTLIEERVREAAASSNPGLRVHRLPAVVDYIRFAAKSQFPHSSLPEDAAFVWCGVVGDGHRDVYFLIRAAARVRCAGYSLKLVIVGRCSERWRARVADYAERHGFPAVDLVITGYVDDNDLEALYRSATALLLPLPDDDKSRTRMPNKLGEYLASGRPVVTCRVGDLTKLLTHGVNAYLAEAGDESGFAEQMLSVLRDPAAAERIGIAGQGVCATQLDFRAYASGLAQFFGECIDCCS